MNWYSIFINLHDKYYYYINYMEWAGCISILKNVFVCVLIIKEKRGQECGIGGGLEDKIWGAGNGGIIVIVLYSQKVKKLYQQLQELLFSNSYFSLYDLYSSPTANIFGNLF